MQAFPEEFGFLVDAAIFSGTGAGQPLGILNSGAVVQVAKEAGQAADTVVAENVSKMWARMWAPSRRTSVWLINQDVEPQLDLLSVPSGAFGMPVYMPPGGLSEAPYGRLKGRPVMVIEHCETVGDAGDIVLADFSQYLLADKNGVETATSIHVQFLTDETVFRFVYRVDGEPVWNAALTPAKGSNTLSPFVKLAARA
jgi:HK97 family phage major capsid protein